ncbi:MAG: di-trans,poly-cis-decaprenylcistransferase [Gemmatimonadetes bacterium]|nr:di-trans,poly-cis-decaprenylcistransferase [Gemmatimonadota bacterium]
MIMDGNGRWANQRGRPRTAGHLAGARTVRQMVEHARRSEIRVLTLYAFSSDNWSRPQDEVDALMRLFRRHLAAETPKCLENDIRISVVGRRDRLSPELRRSIDAAEDATRECRSLHLRLAVDYSARDTMVRAAASVPPGVSLSREDFSSLLASVNHDDGSAGDVDLLIRTGGEQRLSDFLLWECAYAELYFSRRMWPDFSTADFDAAVEDFRARDRRFGGLSRQVAARA